MKLIIVENYEEASIEAAKVMLEVVKNNPTANLGLATGSTPIRIGTQSWSLGRLASLNSTHEKRSEEHTSELQSH